MGPLNQDIAVVEWGTISSEATVNSSFNRSEDDWKRPYLSDDLVYEPPALTFWSSCFDAVFTAPWVAGHLRHSWNSYPIDCWLDSLTSIPEFERRMIWSALWFSFSSNEEAHQWILCPSRRWKGYGNDRSIQLTCHMIDLTTLARRRRVFDFLVATWFCFFCGTSASTLSISPSWIPLAKRTSRCCDYSEGSHFSSMWAWLPEADPMTRRT